MQNLPATEPGGSADRTILLLHGLGCTGAVWTGVERAMASRRLGRCISPDLSGHGASPRQSHYSVGSFAAEVAKLIQGTPNVLVIGHSLGAYVALMLASGWFGVDVAGVIGVGPKINWPDADVKYVREFATRPVRMYATQAEAWARYRRLSGLDPEVAPGEEWVTRGIVQESAHWRLAQDPKTFNVVGVPFATVAKSATAPFVLACGERDHMVTLDELRAHTPNVAELAGAGHNAHVEAPDLVVDLLERLIRLVSDGERPDPGRFSQA